MSQEQLATSIGKTRSLISYIERTGNINKYTLNEIASALQADPEEFVLSEPDFFNTNLITEKNPITEKVQGYEIMVKELQSEIAYLKEIINQQWELLKKVEEIKK